MTDEDERWLTITEAAFYLGTSELTVRRRIKDGKVPAYQGDGTLRIKRSDIDRYLEQKR